jgi:hypothetical protein
MQKFVEHVEEFFSCTSPEALNIFLKVHTYLLGSASSALLILLILIVLVVECIA